MVLSKQVVSWPEGGKWVDQCEARACREILCLGLPGQRDRGYGRMACGTQGKWVFGVKSLTKGYGRLKVGPGGVCESEGLRESCKPGGDSGGPRLRHACSMLCVVGS
ncbi:hypothetical protein PV10_09093, partial [Exophiala mesophila]